MSEDSKFWKARDEYYDPPDDETEQCEHCGGTGFTGHDCGEGTCCCLDPEENVECDLCEGAGYISRSESRERSRARHEDELYDRYKDEE